VLGEEGLLGPGDAVDVGRVAIGQERLAVTPLQMAMVAAAIANKGKLMKPQIWSRVVDPDGRTVFAAVGQEHALRHQAVFREVPGMALGGIATPEDQKVGPVPHLAQRAGDFADSLERHPRRATIV